MAWNFRRKERDELLVLRNLGVNPAIISLIWISVSILLELLAHVAAATVKASPP